MWKRPVVWQLVTGVGETMVMQCIHAMLRHASGFHGDKPLLEARHLCNMKVHHRVDKSPQLITVLRLINFVHISLFKIHVINPLMHFTDHVASYLNAWSRVFEPAVISSRNASLLWDSKKSSLPCSQQLVICPCHEPGESSPNLVTPFLYMGSTVRGSNPGRGNIFLCFPKPCSETHPASYWMRTARYTRMYVLEELSFPCT